MPLTGSAIRQAKSPGKAGKPFSHLIPVFGFSWSPPLAENGGDSTTGPAGKKSFYRGDSILR
jgi:hypothetical protein